MLWKKNGDEVLVDVTWSQDVLTAGFGSAGCERIVRNRGGGDNITDILAITPELFAWLGYNESWKFDGMVGGAKSYSFQQISLSFYLGRKGDGVKPQMFRAEWAGFAEWIRGRIGFQAKNAGHPHWQFDALESVLPETKDDDAKVLLGLLKEDSDQQSTKDFDPKTASEVILDVVRAQKMSRMHFASAAAWWQPESERRHAHSPKNVQQLRDWSSSTLAYIVQEFGWLASK